MHQIQDPGISFDYNREDHPDRFLRLPEHMTQVWLKQNSAHDFIVHFQSHTASEVWIQIKGNTIFAEMDDGFFLQTDLIASRSLSDNLWLFFTRYIDYKDSVSCGFSQQEYIFTRDKHTGYFRYFDDSIHTLSIKSNPRDSSLIRVKYLKSKEAGSVQLKVVEGQLISTDPRYPYAFAFKGVCPQLDDVARVTANIIACMRALHEPEQNECTQA